MIKKCSLNKALTTVSIALLLMSSLTAPSQAAAPKIYKVGDVFSEKGISAGKRPVVTNIIESDFTGDKKNDKLYVIGDQFEKGGNYYEAFTMALKDGKNGKWIVYKPKMEEGYAGWGYTPVVEVTDINSDGTKDALFSSFSGGSGGFVYYDAFTVKGGTFKQVLTQKMLTGLTITGQYRDGFKVEMVCNEIKKSFTIDLSYASKMLIENGNYDARGKILKPTEPWTGPLVDVHADNGMVWGKQAIKGIANADTIGILHVTYALEKGKLIIKEVQVQSTLFGNY